MELLTLADVSLALLHALDARRPFRAACSPEFPVHRAPRSIAYHETNRI